MSGPTPTIAPLTPEMPRFASEFPFPPYAYVNGETPHPRRDPRGHAYRQPEPTPPRWTAAQWRQNKLYLYGIDLYHHGYVWESHEAWEALWRLEPANAPLASFYQGLIMNSAAVIKARAKNKAGTVAHSRSAVRLLSSTALLAELSPAGRYMGLDVRALIAGIRAHYGPLWPGARMPSSEPSGDAPVLRIAEELRPRR